MIIKAEQTLNRGESLERKCTEGYNFTKKN